MTGKRSIIVARIKACDKDNGCVIRTAQQRLQESDRSQPRSQLSLLFTSCVTGGTVFSKP